MKVLMRMALLRFACVIFHEPSLCPKGALPRRSPTGNDLID